jgi:multidrug efflux pump subunit AcrA (membrane-fusion protein)
VGQSVTVIPDGMKRKLDGKVAFISVVPHADSSGTSTTTSYLVIIGLETSTAKLKNGATATVAIVTDNAKAALAVPTSAVTTRGTRHTVEVVDGDSTKTVAVNVGAVGSTWTEITSGLSAGDEVVLADLSQALPGSASDSSSVTNQFGPRLGSSTQFPRGSGGPQTARGG